MFCDKCKDKKCLRDGTVCSKLNEYMLKRGIYGAEWIRPRISSKKREKGEWREIPFSAFNGKYDNV